MMDEETKLMINHFVDGELNKSQEAFLFSRLSENEESRELFKQLHTLKTEIQNTMEEFPFPVERKIFSAIHGANVRTPWYKQFFPVVSYSFAVVLLILSLFMFSEMREYRKEIQLTSQRMIEQQKTINLLINSLPTVEVESELENPIIVKANL